MFLTNYLILSHHTPWRNTNSYYQVSSLLTAPSLPLLDHGVCILLYRSCRACLPGIYKPCLLKISAQTRSTLEPSTLLALMTSLPRDTFSPPTHTSLYPHFMCSPRLGSQVVQSRTQKVLSTIYLYPQNQWKPGKPHLQRHSEWTAVRSISQMELPRIFCAFCDVRARAPLIILQHRCCDGLIESLCQNFRIGGGYWLRMCRRNQDFSEGL